MTEPFPIDGYLRRIGAVRPTRLDLASLTELHRAHLEHVPFENLDIQHGIPIELGAASVAKIVGGHRGGFCYELNGAFAALLCALGFDVTLLQARVYGADGEPGIPFDHLCLLVELDRPYLVDVGFGANFVEPLVFEVDVDLIDSAGTFRIVDRGDGWFDMLAAGTARYRFERAGRTLAEFVPGSAFHQTPESHFAKGVVVTRLAGTGRVTLTGDTLIETIGDERTETPIEPGEFARTLDGRFGIVLDQS